MYRPEVPLMLRLLYVELRGRSGDAIFGHHKKAWHAKMNGILQSTLHDCFYLHSLRGAVILETSH